ncbi:MAG: hypothetical protein GXN93_05070 [Candidatus Diapherotrites archaeon]|nr:hypothetical protein [Candidatus Diapherotrites archaeon]
MIRLDDVRERARAVLPSTAYQPYSDSPTIRSYTNWDAFEDAFSADHWTVGRVSGATPTDAIPSLSFDPSSNRALAHHFARLPSFHLWDGSDTVALEASGNHTAQHVVFCIREDASILLKDIAPYSKSATLDVLVRPGVSADLSLLVQGAAVQYVHLRVHLGASSSFSSRLAVVGKNTHVHYEVFLNGEGASVDVSGGSVGGRSDVITDVFTRSSNNRAYVRHVLFSAPGDFLVHRGVIRVERGAVAADVDMDSAFLTTGGLAVSVPQLEILTDDVSHAAHRSRDLSPSSEQLFYAQTRGVRSAEFMQMYVDSILRSRVGSLADEDIVISAIKSFSESLPR